MYIYALWFKLNYKLQLKLRKQSKTVGLNFKNSIIIEKPFHYFVKKKS